MKRYSYLLLPLALAGVPFASTLTAQQQVITVLQPNQPVERELTGADIHTFSVRLDRGQVLDLVAEQRGTDVVLRVHAPGGQLAQEVDSPNGGSGPERAWMVAESPGTYRIEVAPFDRTAPAGRYAIPLAAPRMATPAEREVLALDTQLRAAQVQGDTATVKRILAEDLTWTTRLGLRMDKRAVLSAIGRPSTAKISNPLPDRVAVRVDGDVAVVTGHVTRRLDQNSTLSEQEADYTRMYVRRNGNWRLMAAHNSGLTQPVTAATMDPAQLNAYAGRYRSEGSPADTVTIRPEGNRLLMQFPEGTVAFSPELPGIFFATGMAGRVVFLPAQNGQPMSMALIPYISAGPLQQYRKVTDTRP